MNRFVLRATLYLLAIFFSVFIVNMAVYNSGDSFDLAEDALLRQKLEHFEQNADQYNTLFIGASTMLFSAIPNVFDSLMSNVYSSRSFNMSIKALLPLRSYEVLERAVAAHPNIKYVFMELQVPGSILYSNFHPIVYNHLNYDNFKQYLSFMQDSRNIGTFRQIQRTSILFKSMTYRYLFPDIVRLKLKSTFTKPEYKQLFPIEKKGYYTWDDEFKIAGGFAKKMMMNAKKRLKSDTLMLGKSAESNAAKYHELTDVSIPQNYLEYLKKEIEKWEGLGIKLVFVIPPRIIFRNSIEPLLLDTMIANRTLDCGDSKKYPEFYLVKNSSDGAHLNHRGGKLFSQTLAREFIKKFGDLKNGKTKK
jgi:hypothetical protein